MGIHTNSFAPSFNTNPSDISSSVSFVDKLNPFGNGMVFVPSVIAITFSDHSSGFVSTMLHPSGNTTSGSSPVVPSL